MAPGYGQLTQLGIGTTSTVDQRLDYQNESLACDEEFIDTNGLRGTLDHSIERVREGNRRIGGSISLQPTAVEMAAILPWITGVAASGTTFAIGDSLSSRYVSVDRITKVFTYAGCFVNTANFRASQGGPLELSLDLVGSDETVGNAGSFPSLSLDLTTGPFIFTDCVLSVGGSNYAAKDIDISINNNIDTDRFFNAQVLSTATNAMDRQITVNTNLPYGDASAVYNSGVAGVAVTATFTNGALSMVFTFVKVAFPRKSPTVGGRQEIMLPMQGIAYKSSTTKPLVITLDSTP